jgi:ABC-type Fe3+ transport system permease subunit
VDPAPIEMARLYLGPTRAFTRVTAPLLLPGALLLAGICFVILLGELPVSVMLSRAGATPLAVRLFNLLHYGPLGSVSLLCLLIFTLVGACIVAASLWLERNLRLV